MRLYGQLHTTPNHKASIRINSVEVFVHGICQISRTPLNLVKKRPRGRGSKLARRIVLRGYVALMPKLINT